MQKITVNIEGMMCKMCESHMDNDFKHAFPGIKKVTSSHESKSTVIITQDDIPDEKLSEVVTAGGYKFISAEREPYEKKGLFGF